MPCGLLIPGGSGICACRALGTPLNSANTVEHGLCQQEEKCEGCSRGQGQPGPPPSIPLAPGARARRGSITSQASLPARHRKLKAQRWQETSPKSQSLGVIWLRPRKLMEYLWSGGYTLIDKIHTAPAFVKFIGWCERWWINQRTNLLIQKDRLCHLRGWE